MNLQIFCVYDKKAAAYAMPFYFHKKEEALRALGDNVNEPGSNIGKHPEDYELYEIGEFNPITGEITGIKPLYLDKALSYKKLGEKNV